MKILVQTRMIQSKEILAVVTTTAAMNKHGVKVKSKQMRKRKKLNQVHSSLDNVEDNDCQASSCGTSSSQGMESTVVKTDLISNNDVESSQKSRIIKGCKEKY
jgi:hypothetical protein